MDEINQAWYRACKEIINRCVVQNMYANAIGLLEIAMQEAQKRTEPHNPINQESAQLRGITKEQQNDQG